MQIIKCSWNKKKNRSALLIMSGHLFLIYHISELWNGHKLNYAIKELEVFSIGITFDIKIEAKKNKMHQLEQIYGLQF